MSRIDLYPQTDSSPSEAKSATGTVVGSKMAQDTYVNGGSIIVGTAAVPSDYDEAQVSYTSAVQEIYIYRKNGNIVRTVTINYTDATKNFISDWSIL
jgi:hypothetical protein